MKAMLKNKKKLVLTVALVVVVATGLVITYSLRSDNTNQAGRIITGSLSVAEPAGITKNTTGDKNISFTIAKPYGELRVTILRSKLNFTYMYQKGDITESKVTVDGISATRQAINYAKIIRGQSSKLLIRYEVRIRKIPKPSANDYTEFSATALSKNDITASDIADINTTADALLRSLIIK